MTKQKVDLTKRAETVFAHNAGLTEVFMTTDGNAFKELNPAENHAQTLDKARRTIKRFVLDDGEVTEAGPKEVARVVIEKVTDPAPDEEQDDKDLNPEDEPTKDVVNLESGELEAQKMASPEKPAEPANADKETKAQKPAEPKKASADKAAKKPAADTDKADK